jgi:type IV secretion system protein VirD4
VDENALIFRTPWNAFPDITVQTGVPAARLSTTKTFLDLYRDPTVAKNTSRSDFRIRDLMHYADPVSLYIITQPNDKARLRPLVRIVVNMIVRLLADKMEFENGRPKPTYKHKLLATIDEFPALGKLEILQAWREDNGALYYF